jgi:hypothetical protein
VLSPAFLRCNGVIHRTQKVIQVYDNGHVGRPCQVSPALPYPELFASYWASTVTRTSGRGHVAEAKTNDIEVNGFLIRVSKETLLTLNVHFCVQLQHKDAEYRSLVVGMRMRVRMIDSD